MNQNICHVCGGERECTDGRVRCSVCGAYKPSAFSDEENELLQEAFQKLRLYEFDEAERDFCNLIEKYPHNSEAYWGRLLSKRGIKFEWTFDGFQSFSADIFSEQKLTEDPDYLKALSLADGDVGAYYRKQAESIDSASEEKARVNDAVGKTESDTEASDSTHIPEGTEPLCREILKKRKNILWISGSALTVLLVTLALMFTVFRTKECIHAEATEASVLPTCTQEGKTEWRYCTLCGEILVSAEVIPVLGHSPEDTSVCTEDQHCTVCGEILRPAAAHMPGEAATCTQVQECLICHAELAPMTEHTPGEDANCHSGQHCIICNKELVPPSHVPGAPATCTEGQTCLLCGTVLDPGGHKETILNCSEGSYCEVCNEQLSEPFAHVPGDAPTCTKRQTCTLCGEELAPDNGHVPNGDVSCTEDSVCTVCNEVLEKAYGHTISEFTVCTEAQVCLSCNLEMVPAAAHMPGSAATCTEEQKCLVCDVQLAPALNHDVSAWTVDAEPALGVAGSEHGDCSICGETVHREIAALYSDGLLYIPNANGTYSIGGAGNCTDAKIALPSVHEGIPVTAIAANAFYNCSSLTEIVIPVGITAIGDYAFYLCGNLTGIKLPEGMTDIGNAAFSGCTAVTELSLPDTLVSLGDHAFSGCASLTEAVLPVGITNIGNSAFANCGSLKRVTFPKGVTSIGARAFYYCSQLTEIVIPDTVTDIGDYAFYFCTRLNSLSLSAKLKTVGAYAFYRCTDLTEIVLPNAVTEIGDYAFSFCIGIVELRIPASIAAIGSYGFDGCRRLKSISFGGTAEQWKKISLGEGWNDGAPADKATCADGEVSID